MDHRNLQYFSKIDADDKNVILQRWRIFLLQYRLQCSYYDMVVIAVMVVIVVVIDKVYLNFLLIQSVIIHFGRAQY